MNNKTYRSHHLECVGSYSDRSREFVSLKKLYKLCGAEHVQELLHQECVVGVVGGEVLQEDAKVF